MKSLYFILLLLIFTSCQKSEKSNIHSTIEKKTVQEKILDEKRTNQDSVSIKNSSLTNDTLAYHPKAVKNILVEKGKKSSNKIKSISELWKQYKNAKAMANKFVEKNELDSIIYYLNIAADASYELSRKDIATWQLNNIGYYSINEFKNKTDYDIRMQKLATIKNLREKALYTKETKNVFRENFDILAKAQNYLYKAQLLDSELEPSDRTEKIERNLKFIEWIKDFISVENRTSKSR